MKTLQYLSIILIAVGAISCGSELSELDKKKAEVGELRAEADEIKGKIMALEAEIAELDPTYGINVNNIILVSAKELASSSFEHKVEIRGTVKSRKNVLMSAETMGKIQSIKVSEGQKVRKGETLIVLNADVIRSSIREVNTQLELANVVFERQSNLWDKKIGTEIQYLEAKNNKASLESKLKTLQSQLAQAIVTAPFNGSIDEIPVNEGEMAAIGMPLLRIVEPDDMYISADVSEAYVGKFNVGDEVEVALPALNQSLTTKISAISKVLKRENRTFEIELSLPDLDFAVQPNQVAVLDIVDYQNDSALVVPTKLVQKDSKGNFIYEIINDGEKQIAKKAHIEVGVTFDHNTEVLQGLEEGQLIAMEGYRDLAPNVAVNLAK